MFPSSPPSPGVVGQQCRLLWAGPLNAGAATLTALINHINRYRSILCSELKLKGGEGERQTDGNSLFKQRERERERERGRDRKRDTERVTQTGRETERET